jgi:hypothetical protein
METSVITDWKEALEIVIGRTKHERYRVLTADSHPGHAAYRRSIIAKANNLPPPQPEYSPGQQEFPTLLEMAGSAAAAAKRLAFAWMRGNEVTVSLEEMEERLAKCMDCEHFDHRSIRCRRCGCWLRKKAALKTEHCPLDPPKW